MIIKTKTTKSLKIVALILSKIWHIIPGLSLLSLSVQFKITK